MGCSRPSDHGSMDKIRSEGERGGGGGGARASPFKRARAVTGDGARAPPPRARPDKRARAVNGSVRRWADWSGLALGGAGNRRLGPRGRGARLKRYPEIRVVGSGAEG
jgi:hypothetical protein